MHHLFLPTKGAVIRHIMWALYERIGRIFQGLIYVKNPNLNPQKQDQYARIVSMQYIM